MPGHTTPPLDFGFDKLNPADTGDENHVALLNQRFNISPGDAVSPSGIPRPPMNPVIAALIFTSLAFSIELAYKQALL